MTRKLIALPLLAFLMALCSQAFAQRIELTPFAGYQFWGAYKYGAGKLQLQEGAAYGGTLGFEIQEDTWVELLVNHQDSYLVDRPYNAPDKNLGDIGVNYFTLNGARSISVNEKVAPVVNLGLGAALFDPTGNYQSAWKFAVNGGLGLKYYASDKVGLRLGVNFWAPMQGLGFGVGFGTGGAYAGASTYTTIIQMSVNGGLIFRLK